MTSSYFDEFGYTLVSTRGALRVRGIQCGRLAVRRTSKNEVANCRDGRRGAMCDWSVDHWPSGFVIMDAETLEDALQVADAVNCYSAGALDARSQDQLVAQLGAEILAWLRAITDRHIPFREWRAARKAMAAA